MSCRNASLKLPDAGYQLLALYRFWNIAEYRFPYRDVIGENWDEVLTAFIPRIALATDSDAYKREMMALIARLHDTHANLWSSLDVRPPTGACRIPVTLRFIENTLVVSGYSNPESGPATGLQVGDIVDAIDAVAVGDLVQRWTPVLCGLERADAVARHRTIDDERRLRRGDAARPPTEWTVGTEGAAPA